MTTDSQLSFSVILPVYSGDSPVFFEEALKSTISQTVPPSELLIIEDGELTEELYAVIEEWQSKTDCIRRISNEQNRGLSESLSKGVRKASYNLVARMDADDICVNDRFEKQLNQFELEPDLDVVGGNIREFSEDDDSKRMVREVPTSHEEIREMANFRNPLNHVTVMFRKDAVISSGNYRPVDRMEDYGLWVRLLLNDKTFKNIPEVLVDVRGGEKMYSRRGGLEYAKEEIRLQAEFYRWGFISRTEAIRNMVLRTGLRLTPNSIRGIIYEKFARS